LALVRFDVGQSADVLSPGEHKQHLKEVFEGWDRGRGRGIDDVRFYGQGLIASDAVVIPSQPSGQTSYGSQYPVLGPEDGYVWSVRRISVYQLTGTSDVLYVFRGQVGDTAASIQPSNFIDTMTTANPVVTLGSGRCTLRGGEQLVIVGAALSTTGTLTVSGEAVRVPAEMKYKVL
jgi:hypothetical protein